MYLSIASFEFNESTGETVKSYDNCLASFPIALVVVEPFFSQKYPVPLTYI